MEEAGHESVVPCLRVADAWDGKSQPAALMTEGHVSPLTRESLLWNERQKQSR